MAEARQAVAFQFAVTEGGIQVHFDKEAVKSAVQALLGFTKSRYLRARNALLKGVYPASPWSLVPILLICSYFSGRNLSSNRWFGFQDSYAILVLLVCEVVCMWVLVSYVHRYTLKMMLCYKGWMFDPHQQQSKQTKIWGMGMKLLLMFAPQPQLYSFQSSLPRLPVPALKDTCRQYLDSVKALLDDEEYQEMKKLVGDFQTGLGRRLQKYLQLKSWWANNYVTDWWETYVYLYGRSSIMINSNYYACDMIESHRLTSDPVARAALISHVFMKLKREVEREKIKPLMVLGVVPLCSAQYKRIFGTTRLPGKATDKIVHCSGSESDYLVCYCKGRWFKVPLTSSRGKIYDPAVLEHMFQAVWADGSKVQPGEEHLAALTALNRTEWSEAYEAYFANGVNKASMEVIEKAAFVLIFEDQGVCQSKDFDLTAYSKDLLHGTGHTRWFDKSITLVVYPNAKVGINAEHSWADAPIVGYVMEYSCNMEHTIGYGEDGHCKDYLQVYTSPLPQRLEWALSPDCVTRIQTACTFAQEQISDLDLHVLKQEEFGKGVMKRCKISPDAFIQMALQMAYYRDAGKFCLTYEASMTRLYLEGRTETVRPVTTKSAAFVRAMCDPDDSMTSEKCIKLLREATDHHARGYKLAMTGKGIDRHLFCLYVVSKYLKVDSPFLNKVLHEPWRLSTSQTPSQQTGKIDFTKNPEKISGGGGFGPVTKDGYGVSYIIQGENVILFHVSAFKSSPDTDAQRFALLIQKSLRDIKDLFSEH